MCRMGLSRGLSARVMNCLSSVTHSFRVNGQLTEKKAPSRGLRQGDPISPYLFLLCGDVFFFMLRRAAQDGRTHGARICRDAPRVRHLFLADDSLLFAPEQISQSAPSLLILPANTNELRVIKFIILNRELLLKAVK